MKAMNKQTYKLPAPGGTDHRRDGAILPIALIMVVLLSFLGVGLLKLSGVNATEASKSTSAYQAFWASNLADDAIIVFL